MNELKKYLKNTLGIEPKIRALKVDVLKTLPLYIANVYTLYYIELQTKEMPDWEKWKMKLESLLA